MTASQLKIATPNEHNNNYPPSIADAIHHLATESGIEARGAIYTRTEVVEFILDLIGYTSDKSLHKTRLLEPSFGGGEFLLSAISRLIASWRDRKGTAKTAIRDLSNAIRAVELHKETFDSTHSAVIKLLQKLRLPPNTAITLTDCWLSQGDFLLLPLEDNFDYVIGNPPYVRQELIPKALLTEYRARYKTIYDRADLYIPFIERSLSALNTDGQLGFICADRWMKNRYGGPLRKFVADNYHLKIYVDMTGTEAFHTDVSAYPAITIITRQTPGSTRIAHRPIIKEDTLKALTTKLTSNRLSRGNSIVKELSSVTNGSEPWLLQAEEQTTLIRRLEKQYPTIEETGCKVGIGVATGADKAFIGNLDELDVEQDRKLPLVTTKDVMSGEVKWQGRGIINPFSDNRGLVNLKDYPLLATYLEEHRELIQRRHCAQKNPANWYRTIDRITPSLAQKKKLLIPDIKGRAHVVYEDGNLYPHHNLYYITSDQWDLHALQAVLLSSISKLFVATYSTKMRGGFLRFQAQYLRRIRIPPWKDVKPTLRTQLKKAAKRHDIDACNNATFKLYGLSNDEITALDCIGD